MKTKHIFGTILMAALTAACSNEDLQLVEQSAQVGERIELGEVTLSLGKVESRFVVGDNFNDLTAELGDKVGAALIDAPNGEGNTYDAKYNYDLTSYISTNYAYEYNGSVWTTPAKMVEGNYMFYAPYNAAHATRKPIVAKLDAVQQLVATSNGVDELSTIKQMIASGNVMAVSHEFIAASDEANIQTALVPVYAYPYITLVNDYAPENASEVAVPTDLVVNQIVIQAAKEFTTSAPFEFEAGKTAITADDDFVFGLRDFTYYKSSSEPNKALKGAFAKSLGIGAYTSAILGEATTTSSAIVVKAPNNGLKVTKNGGSVSFYAVIPAAQYTDGLTISVYTNKGVFSKTITSVAISAGKRYPEAEYNSDGTATIVPSEAGEAAKGEIFTISMEEPNEAGEATLVATTEDLLALIQNSTANADNTQLLINTLTKDVKITSAVMSAIKAKSYAGWEVIFNTPVTIATNLNSANKKITFKGGAEIIEGTIELNNKVKFEGNGEIKSDLTVKGGTVTVSTADFTNGMIVNKGGNVTLNAGAYVDNQSGTLTIAKSAGGEITNNGGTITFTAGTSGSPKTYANAINNKKGTLTVPAYTVATGITDNGSSTEVDGETVTTTGIIEVNGTATIAENITGTITVNGTATVETNNALITMGSSSASLTVSNNGSYVNNTKNGTVKTTEGGTIGKVYYEFNSDVDGKLIAKSSTYNLIVLNGMTWSPEADQKINVPVEMREATIAVWDAEIEIEIAGALTTMNTNNNTKSKVIGVAGAKVYATSIPTTDFENPQGIAKVGSAE